MSRTKSAILAASAVATTVVGLTALLTAPAVAAPPPCPTGNICVYNDSGSSHAFFTSDPDFSNNRYADGSPVENNVASVSNSSAAREAHFYLQDGYDTFLFCVSPGSAVAKLPGAPHQASSLLLRPGTSIPCY